MDQRGEGEWRQLTDGFHGFMNQPVWSPDSKYLVFSDKFMKLHLVDAASGKTDGDRPQRLRRRLGALGNHGLRVVAGQQLDRLHLADPTT